MNRRSCVTIDLLGDDFRKAVNSGDPIKVRTDGTVEGRCLHLRIPEAKHEQFSDFLGHTGLVELFDVGNGKDPRYPDIGR
jgi:hypothetical protein